MTKLHKNDWCHGDEEPFIPDLDSIYNNLKFCHKPKLKLIIAVASTDVVLSNAQDLTILTGA